MAKKWRPEVISWSQADRTDPEHNPDSSSFDLRILAEGDSWFTLGGIPTFNLLFSMRFDGNTVIINCAFPGDTIRRMSTLTRDRALRDALSPKFGS